MPKKKLCDCTIREILAYAIDHTDEIEVQSCVGQYQDGMTKKIEIFADYCGRIQKGLGKGN